MRPDELSQSLLAGLKEENADPDAVDARFIERAAAVGDDDVLLGGSGGPDEDEDDDAVVQSKRVGLDHGDVPPSPFRKRLKSLGKGYRKVQAGVGDAVVWDSRTGPTEAEFRGQTMGLDGWEATLIVREEGKPPFQITVDADQVRVKSLSKSIYGYRINHDFRCAECAEGMDVDDTDEPVTKEPPQGFRCGGCGQFYLGGGEWGTRAEWREIGSKLLKDSLPKLGKAAEQVYRGCKIEKIEGTNVGYAPQQVNLREHKLGKHPSRKVTVYQITWPDRYGGGTAMADTLRDAKRRIDDYMGDEEKSLASVKFQDNPYQDTGCPICGEHAVGSCRCSGPHSLEDLKNGHGLKCPNGHRFSRDGSLAVEAEEKSLPGYRVKDGFTGRRVGRDQVTRCYVNGVQVACPRHEDPWGPRPGRRPASLRRPRRPDEIDQEQGQEEKEGEQRQGQDEQDEGFEHTEEGAEHVPPPPGEKIAKAPCCLYAPDVSKPDKNGMLPSRIGVPADSSPPPPREIPRLPNLTEAERDAETRFADAYLSDPEGVVASYMAAQNHVVGYGVKADATEVEDLAARAKEAGLTAKVGKKKDGTPDGKLDLGGEEPALSEFLKEHALKGSPKYEIGDAPNIFNTDDAKLLSPDYNPKGADPEEVKNARGVFNLAVHQTGNAVAKKAFLTFMDSDTFKNLPEEKRFVLVTSGGVASGKGYALSKGGETAQLQQLVGAVWDAAGEQNAAENPWILEEARKRGVRVKFAFIHADPVKTWENPERGVVQRANNIGRMVDYHPFVESYSEGPKNFKKFMDDHIEDPDVDFYLVNNATGGEPEMAESFPDEALGVDADALRERCASVLRERAGDLRPSVVRGGSIGERVWGRKKAAAKSYLKNWLNKGTEPGRVDVRREQQPRPGDAAPAEGKALDPVASALLAGIKWNNENVAEADREAFERSLKVRARAGDRPGAAEQDDGGEDDSAAKGVRPDEVGRSPFRGRGKGMPPATKSMEGGRGKSLDVPPSPFPE